MEMTETLSPIAELHDVTPEQFEKEVLPQGRPVVMRGLVRDWPAVGAARQSAAAAAGYVRRFDAGRPVETIFGDPAIEGRFFYNDELTGLNFERRPERIGAALDELLQGEEQERARSVYIQSVPTPQNLPGFAEENRLPFLPPSVPPRIWIGNALTVQTHFDLSQNIACVVAGRRRFTLFPPDQLPNLYAGPFELTLAGPPVSMVRLEDPDHERYPRFREALGHALTAELGPGDALFVPYFWWHHVQSLERFNILVNYWWNEAQPGLGSPFDALLHAILAVRDLPPQQREVWRGVFDHYAFKANGEPVEHLPQQARGALGPHTERDRARIWAMLANAVGRQAAKRNGPPGRPPRR